MKYLIIYLKTVITYKFEQKKHKERKIVSARHYILQPCFTYCKCRVQMVSSMVVVICICCPKGCVSKHSPRFGSWWFSSWNEKEGQKVTWKDPMINIFCSLLWVTTMWGWDTHYCWGKKVNIGTLTTKLPMHCNQHPHSGNIFFSHLPLVRCKIHFSTGVRSGLCNWSYCKGEV